MINLSSKELTNVNYCALFRLFPLWKPVYAAYANFECYHSVPTTSGSRPWRRADKDQLNIANVLPQIFLVWTRLISWSCLITAHFRWLADTGNGPLVLHPGHPPPPPRPRGRHLHRRGRPLPLHEGDDQTRHCPCIIVILSGRAAVWSSCRFILTSWEQGNTWPLTFLAPDLSSSLTQLKS